MIPAEDPHGNWMMDVPEKLDDAVRAGTFVVCNEQGMGLADLLD